MARFKFKPSQFQRAAEKSHRRNKCSEDSIDFKHKLHMETITQPRERRFSLVGILP